jgi:ProP effector
MMDRFYIPASRTMTDVTPTAAPVQPPAKAARQRRPKPGRPGTAASEAQAAAPAGPRPPRINPTLEKLAEFYPHLFGEVFLPLKRGIFQELLTAHPEAFQREALKEALGQHTRSTRYLTAVAAGRPRHDLQGEVVEAMAPEHVYQALLEVFRRRQGRSPEDLRPKLRERIVQAFESSGLPRTEYAELVRTRDEAANALLEEALAEAAARSAKDEALLRAFEASSQTIENFAGMYGMDPRAAARSLERAKRLRP